MSRRKIIHLVVAPNHPGAVSGPEVLVRDHLLPGATEAGFEAQYVTTDESVVTEQLRSRGQVVELIPYRGWPTSASFARALRRLLARSRPDLLVSHGPCLLDWLVCRGCRGGGVPHAIVRYVVLEDMHYGPLRRPVIRALDDRSLRAAAGVAFASPRSRDRAVRRLGLDPGRVRFISVPIDLERFSPAAEKEPSPTVVGVGQLVAYKGWEVFLRVVREVRREVPDVRARIYGDGPLRSELIRRRDALGLADCVEMIPRTDDMPAALRQGSVYLSTSRREGLSIAAAEAVACGLPMVLTDVSGSDVLVAAGVNGSIVPIGDVSALVAEVTAILTDEQRRTRMAAAGRERAEKLFNPRTIRRQYTELFQQAAEGA